MIANGGTKTFQHVQDCMKETGVDGVMSAEGILENPAIFNGHDLPNLDKMTIEYLGYAKKYNAELKQIKAHVMKFLYKSIEVEKDLI